VRHFGVTPRLLRSVDVELIAFRVLHPDRVVVEPFPGQCASDGGAQAGQPAGLRGYDGFVRGWVAGPVRGADLEARLRDLEPTSDDAPSSGGGEGGEWLVPDRVVEHAAS